MADAHGKLEFRTQAKIDSQAGNQVHIIDLMLNNITIVGHSASLFVDLSTNDVSLIIHLVPGIAGIILVIAKIDPGIAAVPLKCPDHS